MKKLIIIAITIIATIGVNVKAINISTINDIGEIEDIVEIAINNDKDLYNKRYVIAETINGIKMIIFNINDYEITNNTIGIEKGKIITKNNSINTIEEYNDIEIEINDMVYSNIPGLENSKANIELEQYTDRKNIVGIAMIGLGVILAILLLKE